MDEYLFITMAKLKADRLKLEREQRQATAEQPSPEPRKRERRPWAGGLVGGLRWTRPWREQS